MTLEPTLHDIARGYTGDGNDDDADDNDDFTNEGGAFADGVVLDDSASAVNLTVWGDILSRPHVHDAGCNGTLEHSEEVLCGFPGSTGHIYCGVRPSLNGGCS
jgi:hypothetical protein